MACWDSIATNPLAIMHIHGVFDLGIAAGVAELAKQNGPELMPKCWSAMDCSVVRGHYRGVRHTKAASETIINTAESLLLLVSEAGTFCSCPWSTNYI